MQLLGLHQSASILRFKAVTGKQCFTVEMVTMLGKLLGAPQSCEHWKPVEMMETFPTKALIRCSRLYTISHCQHLAQ